MEDETLPAPVEGGVLPEQIKAVEFFENDWSLKCAFLIKMDMAGASLVEAPVMEKVASIPGRKIVFDMGQADFAGSFFLRLCIKVMKLRRGDFAIVNVSHEMRKVFVMAGLGELLKD